MRLRALDWLRGFAVLVMVECHVFNALLAPAYRQTRWFEFFNWLNGFVAPAFLLVSGAVMGLNLQSRWGKPTGKMWRRIGQIFLIAYLLHFPIQLLWEFAGPRAEHLVALWTRMDILQCVAGSLAIVLLLAPVARAPRTHRLMCVALGVFAAMSAEPVTRWIASGVELPVPLRNYVWPTGVGLFPLVPWAGFVWIGVWLGPAIFAPTAAGDPSGRPYATFRCVLGGAMFLVASHFMPSRLSYDAVFVFERMGIILFALAACVWLGSPARGTGWILQFGELSLWSYTVHLLIVYWLLDPLLGARFTPAIAMLFLAAVLLATALVVRWRAKNLQARRALRMMPAQ